MKTPPFLLGAALLFWGWFTGFLTVGALLAVLFEYSHWTKVRWEFSDEDFTRIWTFCSLLLLASAIYAFSSNDTPSEMINFLQNPNYRTQRDAGNSSAQAVAGLIRWLPMIFVPFAAASIYSTREGVPLHTISLILRWRWQKTRKNLDPALSRPVNLSYAYFGLALFSASIHESQGPWFFWGLCILVMWALWPLRSPRFSTPVWCCTAGAAVALGYFGQQGMTQLNQYLGGLNPTWLVNYSRRGFDPRHSRTMLGHVGRLKDSGTIVLRVGTTTPTPPPPLLREASYRRYNSTVWYSGTSLGSFENISADPTNATSWALVPGKKGVVPLNIACYLSGGQRLLPLPPGTARLENLNAYILQRNNFGAVHILGPGLVVFDALHGPGPTIDGPPSAEDGRQAVPENEQLALRRVIEEAQLEGKSLAEAMAGIQQFFASKFTYSTWQELPARRYGRLSQTPLSRFLLETRSGHCEYFATATVLLLRELGFPARYATGYALHESSGENHYVVRQRDAHAWTLVYDKNTWQDFDTTPGSWMAAEKSRASAFQFLADLRSRIWFELSRIRWGQTNLRQYILWGLVPVLGLLLFQIFRARRKRHGGKDLVRAGLIWPGLDSEFYLLERRLAQRGLVRQPGESLSAWLERASALPELRDLAEPLRHLLQLHYRYRFDPIGLQLSERELLRAEASRYAGSFTPVSLAERK